MREANLLVFRITNHKCDFIFHFLNTVVHGYCLDSKCSYTITPLKYYPNKPKNEERSNLRYFVGMMYYEMWRIVRDTGYRMEKDQVWACVEMLLLYTAFSFL